jgi:leucyl aminopeptidase
VGKTDSAGLPPQVSPPQFALSALLPTAVRGVEVLAFPVLPGPDGTPLLGPGAEEASASLGMDLLDALDALAAPGRPKPHGSATAGEVACIPVVGGGDGPRRVLLVGVGEQRPADFRRAGAALARATPDVDAVATTVATIADPVGFEAFVVGVMLGSFGFHWRSTGPTERPVARVVLAGLADAPERDSALRRAMAIGGAGWRSRALATVPANLKTPAWMADQAREVAGESGLDITVWDEEELARRGMGGILGVGQASPNPPRLIRLDYTPGKGARRAPRVVLVGKGITFDTGGLSIKPGEAMVNMKRDMTGGGVVIAVLGALAAVGCKVRVTGLVASAENAIGGDSLRPGDVITHFGGRTSEITNTDAEGRLVLADGLAFAVGELKPDVLVDVATLTGAVRVALGTELAGLFANHDGLAAALHQAGEEAGEPLWRLPLVADYEERLASKIADADNAAGGAGAITAALFLQHFVGDVPWAHLDLASVGDATKERFEWSAGPTGFGARVLLTWLASADPLAGI